MQTPTWQVSVCVQRSPSLQAAPSGFGGSEQTPVAGLQVPASWHWSLAVQTTGFKPTQVPRWRVSAWVRRSESLQVAPSGLGGSEQTPVAGLQVPASWHWSLAVQTTGFKPTQVPSWQVSVWVQRSP